MSDSFLKTEDGTYQTTLTESYKNRKPWSRPNPKMILSYIPGTITQVIVVAGDSIKKGDPLLTFNAMKMSNTYASPIDGVIKEVKVTQGEAVPKGALLVEFE